MGDMGMNLDELERLHRKAVGGDWRNLPSNRLNEIWEAFPALLALARDGERHRERIRALQAEGKTGDLRIGLSIDEHQIAVRLTALSLDREADPLRRVMMETGELYAELRAAIDAARKGERNGNS